MDRKYISLFGSVGIYRRLEHHFFCIFTITCSFWFSQNRFVTFKAELKGKNILSSLNTRNYTQKKTQIVLQIALERSFLENTEDDLRAESRRRNFSCHPTLFSFWRIFREVCSISNTFWRQANLPAEHTNTFKKKINTSQVDSLISLKTPCFNDVGLATTSRHSKSHCTLPAAF